MTHWHSVSTTYQDHGITASRLTKFDTLNIGTTDFTLFVLRVEYHSRSHQIEKIITLSSFNIMRISIILGDCLISDPYNKHFDRPIRSGQIAWYFSM